MYTTGEIKDYLKTLPEIKFRDIDKDNFKLSEFLPMILTYCRKYDTIHLNNSIQTKHGKRRSVGDLYRVTRYYFPRVRLVTIYRTLLEQCANKTAVSAICQETGLRVYRFDDGNGYFNGEPTDEFYTDITQFKEFANCKSIKDSWGYTFSSINIKHIKIK